MILSDKKNSILGYIINNSVTTQRDIAIREDISLGKVNALLKELVEAGYLTAQTQSHRIKYSVTEAGMQAVREYQRRELESVMCRSNEYLAELEHLLKEIAHRGFCKVMLQDMDCLRPMLEYVCFKTGIEQVNEADSDVFVIKELPIK